MRRLTLGALTLALGGAVFLLWDHDSWRGTRIASSSSLPGDSGLLLPRADWELLYEQAGQAQLREEIEALRRFMFEESRDFYEAEFQAGNYQIVTDRRPDGTVPLEIDDGTLSQWRSVPGLGVTRVILPREGFEHVYEARDRASWLMGREEEIEAFEILLAEEE